MTSSVHIRLGLLSLLAVGVGVGACYSSPFVEGWYRCDADDQCGTGFVCDDGVCCNAEGTPICPTRPKGNGLCPDGGAPTVMYADRDLDGFGDPNTSAAFCGPPSLQRYVLQAGDCVDTVGIGSTVFPDAGELCDGLDNDCNGLVDDGLPGTLYYQDADNDGAGDPAVSRTFCAPPDGGWVLNNTDCDPTRNNVSPSGIEVCDGLDNDCKNGVDDSPVGLQQDCVDTTKMGICQSGREVCLNGAIVCQSKVTPTDERCVPLGVDEDCDGNTNNQPGCGGPQNLLTEAGLVRGAGELSPTAADPGPGFNNCQKPRITTVENVTTANVWTGNGASYHLYWVEKPTGSWDLSTAGEAFRVSFRAQVTLNPNTTEPWHTIGQPIFMLCSRSGAATRIRFNQTGNAWMTASPGPYTSTVPLAGNNQWVSVAGGTLSDIYRIEMIVRPSSGGGGVPAFRVEWLDFGF